MIRNFAGMKRDSLALVFNDVSREQCRTNGTIAGMRTNAAITLTHNDRCIRASLADWLPPGVKATLTAKAAWRIERPRQKVLSAGVHDRLVQKRNSLGAIVC
jgi:hypothetical protein